MFTTRPSEQPLVGTMIILKVTYWACAIHGQYKNLTIKVFINKLKDNIKGTIGQIKIWVGHSFLSFFYGLFFFCYFFCGLISFLNKVLFPLLSPFRFYFLIFLIFSVFFSKNWFIQIYDLLDMIFLLNLDYLTLIFLKPAYYYCNYFLETIIIVIISLNHFILVTSFLSY